MVSMVLLSQTMIECLVWNSKKLELKRPKASFFGTECNWRECTACPKLVKDITEITLPRQAIAGQFHWDDYLHVSHLYHYTEPVHAMMKQDALFYWDLMKMTAVSISRSSRRTRVATLQLTPNSLRFPCVFPVLLPFSLYFFADKK